MRMPSHPSAVIPGRAQREPGISIDDSNFKIPDRSASRGPSGMTNKYHRRIP